MKILVTGGNGLVGNALKRVKTNHEMIFVGSREADLTKEHEVESLFKIFEPSYVIHTAAKVGGIGGNINNPVTYYRDNVMMNTNIIHQANRYGVTKFLGFSSVCVFPDGIPILKEELMHQGTPYHTQYAYAAAKRAMDVQMQTINNFCSLYSYCSIIPTNIFGTHDNYDLNNGHVIPSIIHKIYLAKRDKTPLKIWGNGTAKRELLFADDLAKILMQIIDLNKIPQRVIVSRNGEVSIKELVEILCKVSNFTGEVIWETDKPNGIMSRPTDLTVLKSLIGEPNYTDLEEALKTSYQWFEDYFYFCRRK